MKVNSLDASASCRQDKQLISVLDESNKNTEFLANTAAAWKWDKKILNIWSLHLLFCFLRQAPFTLGLNAISRRSLSGMMSSLWPVTGCLYLKKFQQKKKIAEADAVLVHPQWTPWWRAHPLLTCEGQGWKYYVTWLLVIRSAKAPGT